MPPISDVPTRRQPDLAQLRPDPLLPNDDDRGFRIFDSRLGEVLAQHLEASPFLQLALNMSIRQIAWLHGSDRKHEPRASGWRDPQGRHYVHLSAAEWKRTFPTFGDQTHRSVVRCGRDAGLLHTAMNQRRLHIRVDFTKLILLYLASGQSTSDGWLTEPPPAEGTQLSADV